MQYKYKNSHYRYYFCEVYSILWNEEITQPTDTSEKGIQSMQSIFSTRCGQILDYQQNLEKKLLSPKKRIHIFFAFYRFQLETILTSLVACQDWVLHNPIMLVAAIAFFCLCFLHLCIFVYLCRLLAGSEVHCGVDNSTCVLLERVSVLS